MHAAPPSRKRYATRLSSLGVSLLILTGCPHRFDSHADPIPGSTDPTIEREYRDARARLDAGDPADAASRYAAFVEHHPSDALVRSAKIGEARARLDLGQPDKAKELLEPIAGNVDAEPSSDPVVARARFLLGAALVRSGQYARGRDVLVRFRGVATTTDDETELHALFATAAIGLGDLSTALAELQRFWENARPAERRYIVVSAQQIAARLAPADVDRMWMAAREPLVTAFVGPRYADERRRIGDAPGVGRADLEIATARARLGLDGDAIASQRTLKGAIGCALPLSGKLRVLGERALRGALLGAELLGAAGGQGALVVEVRDTGSDPARARAAVEDLASDGVLAIIGPPDRASATEVAAAASAIGVPVLSLGADDKPAPMIFRFARPRSDAATAAARMMAAQKLSRVAVLAPDGPSGRELARVFTEAARALGLQLVADVRFGEAATTFVQQAKKIDAARPQALFVPATAAQLDLLAPQLASSGLVAMANLKPSGHEVHVFATADGLSAKSLVRSGKYLQGATLLPPFWADPGEPRAAALLDRYREAYGEEPSVLDALAFDAVRALRLVVSQHGQPQAWTDVAADMRQLDAGGLTGALGFAADGARVGDPTAWIVDGATLRAKR